MKIIHAVIHPVGALALVLFVAVCIVLLMSALNEDTKSEDHRLGVQAHQTVYSACGPEAAARFERTFSGRAPWEKVDQADAWAADCARKP